MRGLGNGSQGRGRSSSLISVLVTEIQQRRVCGAGRVLSAQGLGLAGNCDEHMNEEIKQVAAGIPILNSP
ncbi:hypothetical protein BMJ19_33670 [Sinorhizobium medicae]|nr:hypothetical protein BMJ19_33670 [Sinorhizobium medicae]